ncbi:zinc finger protein 343 [Amyelois transitella]|uniref:zinc finger protein 343 n=1 Tax=Amyelois transitella TaxID=680683 RepID=UPI0029905A3B|nr:zinc finger protein 343 [Amyelois transitella]
MSWLCFICHSVVNSDTSDEFRDKYRELIGMNLCLDSYLCVICCHMLDKFWYFKSICLKRSLEYPVLFRERGTVNLQTQNVEITNICIEEICNELNNNNKSIHYLDKNNHSDHNNDIFDYNLQLPEENNDFVYDKEIVKEVVKEIDEFNATENELQSVETLEFKEDNIANNDDDYNSNDEVNEKKAHDVNTEALDSKNYAISDQNGDKIKPKSKSKIKREFDKVILSLEQQKANLERNRKEKKYIEAEFKCYNCALGFLFKDTYQAHMMRHEESNGEYRCEVCTLRFASQAVLRSHTALHAERHVCRRCGGALRPRARAPHAALCYGRSGDVAACDKCPRLFKDPSGLQQHLKRFHQTKVSTRTYPCSVCGKNYSNQAAVRTHMIKHIRRKFPCPLCPSTFSSPYTLTQHKRKHTAPSAEIEAHCYCAPCGKSFVNRKSLLAHRRNAKQHQEEQFDCPICARSCANQRSLNHHIEAVHSTSKNYACSRCSARYATNKALNRHLRGHDVKSEVKLAVCHLCGRSFKGNNKLNRHLREVCEKERLEEELSSYYAQDGV